MIRHYAKTDPGKVRAINEDYYFADGNFLAVADGLGGHNAGEIASKMTIDIFKRGLKKATSENIDSILVNLLRAANSEIFEKAMRDQVYGGMGTTLTAVVPIGTSIHIVHVGDSRAYLLRDGVLKQLTRDHSLVADMVKAGRLTFKEAKVHPQRSIITRALGTESEIEPDLVSVEIQSGDKILLCTDGLSSLVEDEEIRKILIGEPISNAPERLIAKANELGGYDNITVVVAEFGTIKGVRARKKTGDTAEEKSVKVQSSRALSISAVAIVAMLLVLALGMVVSSLQTVEIRLEDSTAVIYSGYPGREILGVPLYRVVERKRVNRKVIEPFLRDRLSDGATYGNLKEAENQLAKLPGAGSL